jgi:hypothetical protein
MIALDMADGISGLLKHPGSLRRNYSGVKGEQ